MPRSTLLLVLFSALSTLTAMADSRADFLKLIDRPKVAPAVEILRGGPVDRAWIYVYNGPPEGIGEPIHDGSR